MKILHLMALSLTALAIFADSVQAEPIRHGTLASSVGADRIRNRERRNIAPTISGTPAMTIAAGTAYRFEPTARDANGDALTFSVQNKPAWASFMLSTGALTGTPTATNVGSYANVIISVNDGKATTALAAATITVTTITVAPPVSGTATLSWTAPTMNTDGSALTGLAGYKVYYGSAAAALDQTVQIASSTQTSYTITGLSSGTWYFAIKAYDATGAESDLSNLASKTI